MNRIGFPFIFCWLLILAMIILAMWWVHNSHTRAFPDGPVLMYLWGSHGVHLLDFVILAVLLALATVLTKVLRCRLMGGPNADAYSK